MNDQILLLFVIVGGAAGLAIVGVALWMMRQENQPPASSDAASEASTATANVATAAGASPETAAGATADAVGSDPPALASEPDITVGPFAPVDPVPPTTPVSPTPLPDPAYASEPGWLSPPKAPETPDAPSAPAAPPGPVVEQEVLRLWRSPAGRLIVEVAGKRYRTREEMTDFATAQQVINAAKELNQFLNMAPGAPARKPEPERPVVKVSLEEVATQPVKLPSMDIMKQMRYLREQSKKPEVQIKSIMDEINDILQKHIAGTPLAGRGLKVADGVQGGIFSLDGQDYESLEELHDPAARDAVRAAVQEWDRK